MRNLLKQLAQYFDDVLGVTIAPVPWAGGKSLPLFLRDRYDFREVQLFDAPCLLILDKDEKEEPPATVRRHIDQVRKTWPDSVIYVRPRVNAYNRKRLIEHKVPFVVPGNQMYLPELGIDLREYFRKLRVHRTYFSPAAQAVLIHMLLHKAEEFGPGELVPELGYTAMTIGRALDELEAADLAESRTVGRERRLRLKGTKAEVWQTAQPYLRSPVQKNYWICAKGVPGLRAGLTALSSYTTIAEPSNPVFAVSREEWRTLQERKGLIQGTAYEPGTTNIEVWNYSPSRFGIDGVVDRLSLYLSLKETDDERVEAALEMMMGDVLWCG